MGSRTRVVTVVQPYVPKYRFPLFELVVAKFAALDIRCRVAAPPPAGAQAHRMDATSTKPPWLLELPIHSATVRGHWLRWYGAGRLWSESHAIVCELGSGCLDTSWLLLRPRSRRPRVAVWGHVVSYDHDNRVDLMLERWQMKRSDRVFAYTERGGIAARSIAGTTRVTVLMNTVDTSTLRAAVDEVTAQDVDSFDQLHNIAGRQCVAYVGGLDSSKRIPFLAAVLDELYQVSPELTILLCGEGADKPLLSAAVARGQVIPLGFADARLKALVGARSEVMLMPGRVGLVAVESFVLGLPVLTVEGPWQAPEYEYLSMGVDSLKLADSPAAYAKGLVDLLQDSARLSGLRLAASRKSGWPALETMADQFVNGVVSMLSREANDGDD